MVELNSMNVRHSQGGLGGMEVVVDYNRPLPNKLSFETIVYGYNTYVGDLSEKTTNIILKKIGKNIFRLSEGESRHSSLGLATEMVVLN